MLPVTSGMLPELAKEQIKGDLCKRELYVGRAWSEYDYLATIMI